MYVPTLMRKRLLLSKNNKEQNYFMNKNISISDNYQLVGYKKIMIIF